MSWFLQRVTAFTVAFAALMAVTAGAQAPPTYPEMAPEPSAASKFSSSVRSGFGKMTKALTPQLSTRSAPDPISLSVPAKPSAELHVAMARMVEESGDLAKAENHYRQALQLAPQHFDALIGYAHMLDRQGKLGEAAGLYELAAKAHPSIPTAHNDLGICYARQGRLNEAVASIEKAIQLQPKQARYRNNVATILVQAQQIDEAFFHLSAIHPEGVAYYNLGYLLQKTGDKQGAVRLFQEALLVDPSLAEARAWLEQLRPAAVVTEPARRQPQIVAQQPARSPAVVVPPAGSAAPLPPAGTFVPLPAGQAVPQGMVPSQGAPRQLAPLPSIKPLPPVHGRY